MQGVAAESGIRLVDRVTGRSFATAAGPQVVLASRAQRWWQSSLVFEVHRMASHAYDEHTTDGHQLMINLGGAVRMGWLEGAKRREAVLGPDQLCIQSDGDANAPRWRDTLTFATASIGRGVLVELLGEHAPASAAVFPKRHCVDGSAAAGFARALARELATPTEPLYAEALALAFVLHLTATYGDAPGRKSAAPTGKLGAIQLRAVIDFAHAQLAARITLPALAGTIGYSPFQFARLFKATTGHAPHRFVHALRLERARRLLAGSTSIASVAVSTGFYDQAHFTNAFRRAYGETPATYMNRARRA